jgi:hypothetical protein
MRKVLRVLPAMFLLAVALVISVSASAAAKFDIENPTISPNPAQVGDNVTGIGDNITAPVTEGTSFFSIFAPWVWWTIGAIILVLLIMIIVLVAVPSRRKHAGATIKGSQELPGTQAATPMPTVMSGTGQISPPMGYPPAMPEQYQMPGAFPAPGPMAAPYPQYARRPIFSVSNLTITPNQVKAGEPITISAIVSNNGSEAGTYSVVLRINGMVENIIDLMLSPGASQATTFTVVKDIGGEYYVEVDGLSGTVIVIPLVPATFTVSNLVIVPERAKQGESVIISAIVTNNGELAGNYNAILKLKGAVESTEEIDLSPGETRKVSFKIAKTTPGFYNVELEGLTGRFVVEMEWQA